MFAQCILANFNLDEQCTCIIYKDLLAPVVFKTPLALHLIFI